MLVLLGIIFALVSILPFLIKRIEHNLEFFLLAMGLAASIAGGVLSLELLWEVMTSHLLYLITAAVLTAGLLFKLLNMAIRRAINAAIVFVPFKILIFGLIILLGLGASVITAIIASLLLVEIVSLLPISRGERIKLSVLACFSIGLGAALTPVGEPLSTIVVSKLHADFWFLFREIGPYIFPCIVGLGCLGAFFVKQGENLAEADNPVEELEEIGETETYASVSIRALKVFLFIVALELLGAGFKPFIDTFMVRWDSRVLYWANTASAILDNATLAAAEISAKLTAEQIRAILMGLLISGGMLIPGNIPNIITAGRLKISSRDWAHLGVPIGLALMAIYFAILYL